MVVVRVRLGLLLGSGLESGLGSGLRLRALVVVVASHPCYTV